jgi:hypothetical protein
MRKSLLIAALFSMTALSPPSFADGANWLNALLPSNADESAAAEQAQKGVQPQAPQAPQDLIRDQQAAMQAQQDAFDAQRALQTQAMQRQNEVFKAQQQAEREEFDALQKAQREDFESQQLAQAEAFKERQSAQTQAMQNQLDAFKAQQQAAADYTGQMEPHHKATK